MTEPAAHTRKTCASGWGLQPGVSQRSGADGGHCKGTGWVPLATCHTMPGAGPGIPLASVSLFSRCTKDIPGPLLSLQPAVAAPFLGGFAEPAVDAGTDACEVAHPRGGTDLPSSHEAREAVSRPFPQDWPSPCDACSRAGADTGARAGGRRHADRPHRRLWRPKAVCCPMNT